MTAPATRRGSPARRPDLRSAAGAAFLIFSFVAASPAQAQVGAAVSFFSDARLRGYSLSAGRPVALLDLAWDHSGGAYAAASGSFVASSGGLHPFGLQLNGGIAHRLQSGTILDAGVLHSVYSRYSSRDEPNSYTEVYAGVALGHFSSRVAFSPHYFERGSRTLYGEVNGSFAPARSLRLDGHAGLLVPLTYRGSSGYLRTQYDWRVGAARELGPLSLHLILSGGGPGRDRYREHGHGRTRVTLGIRYVL